MKSENWIDPDSGASKTRGSLRVPPHTHTISHHALDHTNIMRPLRRIMRNSHQRSLPSRSICGDHNTTLVIRYLLARPLEQLEMYGWWE